MAVRATIHLKSGQMIQFVAESASFDKETGLVAELPANAAYTVDHLDPESVSFFTTQNIVPDGAVDGVSIEASATPAPAAAPAAAPVPTAAGQ